MSQGTALQQERACAVFDCAASSTHKATRRHWKPFFRRCVLLPLVQSLLLGPAHAAPTAVVEPAPSSSHSATAVVGLAVGNPILPATAEKFQSETDFTDAGSAPLSFGRFYRSTWGADATRPAGALSFGWTHTHSASLRTTSATTFTAVTLTSAEG
ncbi:hypothetical protein GCM10023165_08480 [Variovorax defluvii]|uniref:DUF6531 domain-containing protein n=1 Tax=Variovorax defluvii TaxID=913761 RepID=A0ABP8H2S5_9BURK